VVVPRLLELLLLVRLRRRRRMRVNGAAAGVLLLVRQALLVGLLVHVVLVVLRLRLVLLEVLLVLQVVVVVVVVQVRVVRLVRRAVVYGPVPAEHLGRVRRAPLQDGHLRPLDVLRQVRVRPGRQRVRIPDVRTGRRQLLQRLYGVFHLKQSTDRSDLDTIIK